jgi:hypothetical protein
MSGPSNWLLAVFVWTVELGVPAVVGALAGRRAGTWLQAKRADQATL